MIVVISNSPCNKSFYFWLDDEQTISVIKKSNTLFGDVSSP